MGLPGLIALLTLGCQEQGLIAVDASPEDTGEVEAGEDPVPDADTGEEGADSGPEDSGEAPDTGDAQGEDTGPEDTGAPPEEEEETRPPSRDYDPWTTITIHLHGWIVDGVNDEGQYGYLTGGGPLADALLEYGGLPHASSYPDDPAQVQGTHYYGVVPPDYYTEDDVAEVEALEGIPRYALIVAKQARWALSNAPEATGVNFTCHSMGCEVTRYIIEHDVEGLASDKLIKRWVTWGGVVAGAGLASDFSWASYLFDALLGIDPIDLEHMSYEWVEDNLAEGGDRQVAANPLLGDILTHNVLAVNPRLIVEGVETIALLDWLEGDEDSPNDGIMWTRDELFQEQVSDALLALPSGELVGATSHHAYTDHFQVREDQASQLPGVAAIVGRRRVEVTLERLALDSGHGEGDAEIVVESEARWPWAEETFGIDAPMDQRLVEHRVPEVDAVAAGDVVEPWRPLYASMVFDGMSSISLWLRAVEVDDYAPGAVSEGGSDEALGEATLELPLEDGSYEVALGEVTLGLSVLVVDVY